MDAFNRELVIMNKLYTGGGIGRLVAKIIYRFNRVRFQCDIPCSVKLQGVHICHTGFGIVINPKSVIGEGTTIQHGVTIGEIDGNTPTIGKNCRIGARAMILGGIVIGNNVTIGAGAVVVSSIPDNSLAVGVPARVIKQGGIKNEEHETVSDC